MGRFRFGFYVHRSISPACARADEGALHFSLSTMPRAKLFALLLAMVATLTRSWVTPARALPRHSRRRRTTTLERRARPPPEGGGDDDADAAVVPRGRRRSLAGVWRLRRDVEGDVFDDVLVTLSAAGTVSAVSSIEEGKLQVGFRWGGRATNQNAMVFTPPPRAHRTNARTPPRAHRMPAPHHCAVL